MAVLSLFLAVIWEEGKGHYVLNRELILSPMAAKVMILKLPLAVSFCVILY